jgi:hypothetical protein
MNGEDRPLVTDQPVESDEPVEFEKQLVGAQDFRKITHQFRIIYGINLKLMKKNRKMSTPNWLALETPGS